MQTFHLAIKYLSVLIISPLLVLLSMPCFAQNANLKLSLQEAMEYGLKNRKDIQNQQLNIQISENEIAKIRSQSLPQITAGFDFRYNTKLAAGFAGVGLFGNVEPQILRFGAPHTNSFGLNANYDFFNPATHANKQIAQKNVALEQLNVEKNTIDVKLMIAQAYYAALLNGERERFSSNNLERIQQYYKDGRTKLEDKTISQSDFDRIRLDYENAKITNEEDLKNTLLSQMNLANQLGAGLNVNITLSESLDEVLKSLPASIIAQNDLNKRVEVRQEQLRLVQNQLYIKKQDKLLMPTFSLYANWSALQLSSDFQLFNGKWWFPYHFVGFRVSMNLFDGLLRNKTKNEFRLRTLQNENTLAKLQSDLTYEVLSTKIELQNAFGRLKTAKSNYILAEEIIKTDKSLFQQGKTTFSELKNAEYALATAQNNLLTFYYNFLVAKLNYQKAIGEL
jgi:outer membrane protein TolC